MILISSKDIKKILLNKLSKILLKLIFLSYIIYIYPSVISYFREFYIILFYKTLFKNY